MTGLRVRRVDEIKYLSDGILFCQKTFLAPGAAGACVGEAYAEISIPILYYIGRFYHILSDSCDARVVPGQVSACEDNRLFEQYSHCAETTVRASRICRTRTRWRMRKTSIARKTILARKSGTTGKTVFARNSGNCENHKIAKIPDSYKVERSSVRMYVDDLRRFGLSCVFMGDGPISA